MYDGNGNDNCFSMDGVTSTFPADGSTFAGCTGPNAFSASVQQQMTGFIGENAVKAWNKHPHPRQDRVHPARGVRRVKKQLIGVLAGAALLSAAPVQGATKKTINVGDYYYTPTTVAVEAAAPRSRGAGPVSRRRATSTTSSSSQGPRGVKRFQSEAAATDYAFKRKLTVAGTYKIVCTLHHEMRMTIKVRR